LGLAALFLWGACQLIPSPALVSLVDPGGKTLTEALLPRAPERLPFGEEREEIAPAPGSALSLYPARTRQMMVQLLALFLFYAAVRNNCASIAVLRRLSLAAVFVGSALALLGLLQFATSDFKHVYWSISGPPEAAVFGPFLCRS